MRTPGMSWGEALKQSGEGDAPGATRLRTHVAAEAERSDKSARQSEYDDLFWQAQLAGKDAKEAGRLANNELARRHGEAVNPENMSIAELEASIKSFDPSVMGLPSDNDAEPTAEEHVAGLADLAASMRPSYVFDGQDVWGNVAKGIAERARRRRPMNALSRTRRGR
jgi:hypothetical protein